jgi:hypothetical protein
MTRVQVVAVVAKMKPIRVVALAAVWAAALTFLLVPNHVAQAQEASGARRSAASQTPRATEAPTGFDGGDNGFLAEFCARQAELANESVLSPAIPADECNMNAAVGEFTGPETAADGLGPIFNAAGCGECHIANPILGATSQITETRAGLFRNGVFTDHPGGSLIHSRTLMSHVKFQERVIPSRANVIAVRNTISVLGDGFVEAISNASLQAIVDAQPGGSAASSSTCRSWRSPVRSESAASGTRPNKRACFPSPRTLM